MTQIKLKYVLSLLLLWVILSTTSAVDYRSVKMNFIDDSKCVPKTVKWELSWIFEDVGERSIYIEIRWADEGDKVYKFSKDAGEVKLITDSLSNSRYGITVEHTYDTTFVGGECILLAEAWPYCTGDPRIPGSSAVKGTKVNYEVKVFSKDTKNGGAILLTQPVEYVCVGDKDVEIVFADVSKWNCTEGAINSASNQYNGYNRWTQWVYGTGNTANHFDSKFFVDNNRWKDEDKMIAGAVVSHKDYVDGELDESVPIFKPAKNITSDMISITEVMQSDTGKIFELKLNNWNVCNAYPAGKQEVFGKCKIVVVDKPNPIIDTIIICDDEVFRLYDSELVANYDELYVLNSDSLFPDSVLVNEPTESSNYGSWSGDFVENNKFYGNKAKGGFHNIIYTSIENKANCYAEVSVVVRVIPSPIVEDLEKNYLGVCRETVLDLETNVTFDGDNSKLIYDWNTIGGVTDGRKYLDSKKKKDVKFSSPNSNGLWGMKLLVKYPITENRYCFDAKSYRIYVGDLKVDLPDSIFVCQGEKITIKPTFSNIKPAGDDNEYRILSYKWTGDVGGPTGGTSRDSLQFNATTIGNHTIVNTIEDSRGCDASDVVVVKVLEKPKATIITPEKSVCGNVLNILTTHTKYKGVWRVITKPIGKNPVFKSVSYSPNVGIVDTTKISVAAYGEYEFEYVVTNRICESNDRVKITFVPIPQPDAGDDKYVCGNIDTLRATGSADKAYWTVVPDSKLGIPVFDKTSASPVVTIPSNKPGVYRFVWCLQNQNLCLETDTVAITFIKQPVADFILDTVKGCSPFLVRPINTSQYQDSLSWTSDVAASSSEINPIYEFTNYSDGIVTRGLNLYVAVTTYKDHLCFDNKTVEVDVFPAPIAKFSTDYRASCSPVIVSFKNESERSADYTWTFPDEVITTKDKFQKISQAFEVPGNEESIKNFLIKLETENTLGCRSEDSMYVTVFPTKQDTFAFSNNPICAGDEVRIQATGGARTYNWETANGIPEVDHYMYIDATYKNLGLTDTTYVVKLNTVSPFGCKSNYSDTLIVHPPVEAKFTLDKFSDYHTLTTTTIDSSINATTLIWDWGENFNATDTTLIANPNLSHTYTNDFYQKLFFDVKLTALNKEGCHDDSVLQVEVKPTFKVDFSCDTVFCSPAKVQFSNTSDGINSLTWDFGDGTPIETDYIVRHTFTHDPTLGDEPDTFAVKLVGKSYWGEVDSVIRNIVVYPSPIASWVPNVIGEDSIDFTNTSQRASYYKWVFNGDTIEDVADGQTHRIGFETGEFVSSIVASLVATNSHCSDTMRLVTKVDPVVHADFTVADGCSPLYSKVESISRGAIKLWWKFGDGNFTTGGSVFNHRFENNTDSVINIPITLLIHGVTGEQDSITRSVTVYPTPKANFNAIDQILTGTELPIANTATHTQNDKSYWWFGDGTEEVNNSDTISHRYINSTDTRIDRELKLKVSNDNNCSDIFTKNVTVHPVIVADFTRDSAGCAPYNCSFQETSTGAYRYDWYFNDGDSLYGNKMMRILDNKTDSVVLYQLTLVATARSGFSDSITKTITVYPEVASDFSILNTEDRFVSPFQLEVADLSLNASVLTWTIGDTDFDGRVDSVFSTELLTETARRTVNLVQKVVGVGGCEASRSQTFNVYPSVTIDFETDTFCVPLRKELKAISKGVSHFQWYFSDDNSSSNREKVTRYFGENDSDKLRAVEVTLIGTSEYGITDSVKHNLLLHPTPVVDFSSPYFGFATDTEPFNVLFENKSKNVSYYVWDFGDKSIRDTELSGNFTHGYKLTKKTAEVFTVKLTGTSKGGCVDSILRQIEVAPIVEAEIRTDTVSGCTPLSVEFRTNVESKVTYEWDFGDGSLPLRISGASHTFKNDLLKDTTYTVRLIATSRYGYVDTVYQDITVHPTPQVAFSVLDSSVCGETPYVFINETKGAASSIWRFGESDIVKTDSLVVSYPFVNINNYPKSFDVLLEVTNGICSSREAKAVEVMPGVQASFKCDTVGCSPLPVFFISTSHNAAVFAWDFGDGSTSKEQNPLHLFTNTSDRDTVFTVTLVAGNGYDVESACSQTVSKTVLVHPEPDFELSLSATEISFPDATIAASANVKNNANWEYTWDFGDGTPIVTNNKTVMAHEYRQAGGYRLSLTVQNGHCEKIQYKTIEVYPGKPTALFSGEEDGCSPHTVNFINESSDFVAVMWDFGDGYIGGEENASHIFLEPKNYDVRLIVYNAIGMTDTITKKVTVHPGVTASFLATPNKISSFAQNVNFTNLSQKADSYFWSLDEGMTSSEESPIVNYHKKGLKDISLVAISNNGCSDTMLQTGAIDVAESHSIALPNAFVPSSPSNGGGFTDKATNVFHPTIEKNKIVEYTFQVFNRWGQMLFESDQYEVGWDGYHKGVLAPQDVYVYKVKVLFDDGREEVKTGDITLLR